MTTQNRTQTVNTCSIGRAWLKDLGMALAARDQDFWILSPGQLLFQQFAMIDGKPDVEYVAGYRDSSSDGFRCWLSYDRVGGQWLITTMDGSTDDEDQFVFETLSDAMDDFSVMTGLRYSLADVVNWSFDEPEVNAIVPVVQTPRPAVFGAFS